MPLSKYDADGEGPAKTVSASCPQSTGWLAYVPRPFVPYLELMRLDRPNGYWYFWYPHLFGMLTVAIEQRAALAQLLQVNLILLWGVLIMRGATCTWNDAVDVDFDRQVSRCRSRPIARGAVSVAHAHAFMAAQTLLSLATLCVLPPLCILYAMPAIMGWIAYPLAKRVTYYPQVVLGFPMAWGIYMGAAAMGADPLHLAPMLVVLYDFGTGKLDPSPLLAALQHIRIDGPIAAFYGANVLWTLLYELVYSHQDAIEDIAADVKNLVLLYANPEADTPAERFGTLPLLSGLAGAQVLFLAAAGALGGWGAAYSTISVAGTAAALAVMLSRVRLHQPTSCAWWFKVGNARFAGGAMATGLMIEYAVAHFR